MNSTYLADLNARYEAGEPVEVLAMMPTHDGIQDKVFLVPQIVGMADLLLFQRVLVQCGVLEFPPAGSVLRCMVKKEKKGPRVEKVMSIQRKNAALNFARQKFGPEKMKVKFFNAATAFGFFTRDDGIDVFLHISTVHQSNINPEALTPGAEFMVEYQPSPKGFQTLRITS